MHRSKTPRALLVRSTSSVVCGLRPRGGLEEMEFRMFRINLISRDHFRLVILGDNVAPNATCRDASNKVPTGASAPWTSRPLTPCLLSRADAALHMASSLK